MDDAAGGLGLEGFGLGDFRTNCYLAWERTGAGPEGADGAPAWLVDVGASPGVMLDRAGALGLAVEAIVLTHAHADHMAGVAEARARFPGARILLHELEHAWLLDPELNLSARMGMPVTAPPADGSLVEGRELRLGGLVWHVLHTPGHTPGSVSLFQADAGAVLAGDALFAGSIGRTDFPGGSFEQLAESIRGKLYPLGDEVAVFPGHGPATTIGAERHGNPFVPG